MGDIRHRSVTALLLYQDLDSIQNLIGVVLLINTVWGILNIDIITPHYQIKHKVFSLTICESFLQINVSPLAFVYAKRDIVCFYTSDYGILTVQPTLLQWKATGLDFIAIALGLSCGARPRQHNRSQVIALLHL